MLDHCCTQRRTQLVADTDCEEHGHNTVVLAENTSNCPNYPEYTIRITCEYGHDRILTVCDEHQPTEILAFCGVCTICGVEESITTLLDLQRI